MTATVYSDISSFYREWHIFESNLPADRGTVIDFDYCPDERSRNHPAFSSRLEILSELENLRARVASIPSHTCSNAEFLSQKLTGSAAYLRALLGERQPFSQYLQATLGLEPVRVPASELAAHRERAEELLLTRLQITWDPAQRDAYVSKIAFGDSTAFGESLRVKATKWVRRVTEALQLSVEPFYRIETAEIDEYWSNWIDGKLGQEILLRVNLHPRILLRKGQDESLAAHEIAGHAMHVLTLNHQREQGLIESPLMNCTVHSCEMFQMEGVAQSVIHLLSEPGELHWEVQLNEALQAYHDGLKNNAHIDIEAGKPVDEVICDTLRQAPFLSALNIASDIRDRSRNPTFRAYLHVYYASRREFLRGLQLSYASRRLLLKELYTGFYTPPQIAQKIDTLLGAECARVPD